MDSSVDVCDLMINLLCATCSDRACAEDEGQHEEPIWSHGKLMNCIRKHFETPQQFYVDMAETLREILKHSNITIEGPGNNLVDKFKEIFEKAGKSDEHYSAMREFQERNSNQAQQIRALKRQVGDVRRLMGLFRPNLPPDFKQGISEALEETKG